MVCLMVSGFAHAVHRVGTGVLIVAQIMVCVDEMRMNSFEALTMEAFGKGERVTGKVGANLELLHEHTRSCAGPQPATGGGPVRSRRETSRTNRPGLALPAPGSRLPAAGRRRVRSTLTRATSGHSRRQNDGAGSSHAGSLPGASEARGGGGKSPIARVPNGVVRFVTPNDGDENRRQFSTQGDRPVVTAHFLAP